MTAIQDFHDFVMGDVLGHVDGVTSKRMFGGYGMYKDGTIFAIITSDTELRFKAHTDEHKEWYKEHGGKQFIYKGHKAKAPTTMPYWAIPAENIEDREIVDNWLSIALSSV